MDNMTADELMDLPVNKNKKIHWTQANQKVLQGLYCHQCGSLAIYLESPAEGYSCPDCGSSDSDE